MAATLCAMNVVPQKHSGLFSLIVCSPDSDSVNQVLEIIRHPLILNILGRICLNIV